MKRHQQNMLHGPLFPSIIVYTVPIIITSILQLLFNAADLVVVGQFCGSISVAAVGATGSITNLIITVFVNLSMGIGVGVAHAVGSKNNAAIHRFVHTAIPLALVSGVIVTIIGITCAETFLIWMGTPEDVLVLSAVYMRYYFCGTVFSLLYNFCASILRAVGDTRSPLVFLFISGVVNVVLNFIFVIFLHMNVAGVAIATAISQGVSAVLVIRALMRRTDACKLELKKIRFYKKQLLRIITLGLPAGIQGSLISISNVLIQSSINSFGQIVMSGHAAATNIAGFIYMSMNAYQQAAMNFTGQNAGAGQFHRVKKILGVCLVSVAVTGLAVAGISRLFGHQLLSIYINDSDEAISYGLLHLTIYCIPYFLCGMMESVVGVLRGLGRSMIPMIMSMLGMCFFRIFWVSVIFPIPQFHSPQWIYGSFPISWILTLTGDLIAFFFVFRKIHKIHTPKTAPSAT